MKRLKRWPAEWQEWVNSLPPEEQETVLLLVAYLDAKPEDPT